MNAADTVQALEFACHRALRVPEDDMSRVMLLEALAGLKATPLASFPQKVFDLVERSREQADVLSDRVLESNSLSDPSIDQEIRAVCHTLGSLVAAMRPPGDATPVGERDAPNDRPSRLVLALPLIKTCRNRLSSVQVRKVTSTTTSGRTQCTFESLSGDPKRPSRGGGSASGIALPAAAPGRPTSAFSSLSVIPEDDV